MVAILKRFTDWFFTKNTLPYQISLKKQFLNQNYTYYVCIVKFQLESRLYQAFPDIMLIGSVFPHFLWGETTSTSQINKGFLNTPRITNEICIVVYRTFPLQHFLYGIAVWYYSNKQLHNYILYRLLGCDNPCTLRLTNPEK